ncbi:MAG: ROK family protein [Burkholderiales bacterium]|nr:ROK family protein [Betaproteobacteria bacterium]
MSHGAKPVAAPVVIAIDIGGTKIRGALIDRHANMLAGTRYATDASLGASHVLGVIEATIEELQQQVPAGTSVCGIGLSSAGVIEPTSGLVVSSAPQIPGWAGTPLGAHFGDRYQLPVVADNDANCALVGEIWCGRHGLGANASAVMLTLGTGLGGAVLTNGRLLTGRHHLTGHFGIARMWDRHSQTEVKVEHLVSGTGLGNVYRQIVTAQDQVDSVVSGAAVMERFAQGDANASLALERWCEHLVLQVFNLHWMIDPDVIIIGGGMVDSREHWWPMLEAGLAARGVQVPVAVAAMGSDAGVYGAARLVFERLVMEPR